MTTTAASSTCELVVPGLCCVECSLGVVTALRRAAGVQDVRVLGTAEKALVTYDASIIDEASLVHVVEQAGHPVQAWRPLPASRSGSASHRVLEVPALPEREQHQLAAGPSTLAGQQATQTGRKVGFAALRLALVGLVALIALGEIAAESLGLFHGMEELVPAPLALAAVAVGGSSIFRRAFFGVRRREDNTDLVMSLAILAAAVTGTLL